MVEYIPNQGDVVWVSFDPQLGREIKKKRPALVLSLKKYNEIRGIAIVVPVTSKTKKYPLEVCLNSIKINGFILPDQIKTIDWKERNVQYITSASKDVVQETLEKLNLLFGIELE
ncbi:MAG: mRNA-degrading endonuclease [Alphaproteobacteria bacterium 16-39-46]|nr:MAG: mRNA-degrading endonuclease [Alphaproteobacteria bacterium 16-39-46]OZA41981.1 MAG: mRNA-degrading endonuclease [Alphaproteobacteria bacterium 17-39-52]HQS84634.1 type II toxin-antitoxin system PemK/MazF family toxin [Alphaproteobacteria bacterium]HQS94446.1 type II toxin-antitoxin system PemK/MazF family toxin [Alphaproteobacteria bacterium]